MAAINSSSSSTSKAPKHTKHESAPGVRISPGPYIGLVKNNMDTMRSGRLQVWIPDLGGDPGDSASWRTVQYCTPFYGVTPAKARGEGQTFTDSPHSYGMWFVPPDIDVKVICTFINGDPFKGYWFGCIPDFPNLHMVPGLSSGSWHGGGPEPLVEYNDSNVSASGSSTSTFFNRATTVHDYQNQVWARQGLLQDPYRGPGTSSAFRETPSRVFGISTPGPEVAPPSGASDASASVDQYVDLKIGARQGGHQFVMDDGDVNGNSQLIRLRTSNGNMLLMNDTAGFIYLINSTGTAWFEMDAQGNVKVFSQGQMQAHATGGFQFDTPGAFTVSAGSINLSAKSSVSIGGQNVGVNGTMGISLGATAGAISLNGLSASVKAMMCVSISGLMHTDIKGGCITLNTSLPTPSMPSMPNIPAKVQGPTHEPYSHVSSRTNSPVSSASYAAASGVPAGAAGNYGASASFGITPNTPNYYGAYTNANGPIKFNTGLQGSLAGQAANQGETAALNQFDQTAVLYTNTTIDLPFSTAGFAVNVTDSKKLQTVTTLTPGEKQNNPGDLNGLTEDPFAIGQSNGLNLYSTPEDGIAALSVALDMIQADGAMTVEDFIQGYMDRKGNIS